VIPASLIVDIERLRNEVEHLLWLRNTWREVQEIIRANPRLDTPSPFYDFINYSYATATATGVRAVIYRSGAAVCFERFLNEIKRHKQALTRDALVRTHGPRFESVYNRLVGDGALTSAVIEEDVQVLKRDSQIVKKHVDTQVAHFERAPSDLPPRFRDLHTALDHLELVALKYSVLLTGVDRPSLAPLVDWSTFGVLTIPWIVQESDA
jgi:hypothetical protein